MIHTEITKQKISKALKIAHKRLPEWKGYFKKGHPNYNIIVSEETRRKIGEANKGRKASLETRKKQSISAFKRGANRPKNGKIIVCPICKKEIYKSLSRLKKVKNYYCSKKCAYKDFKGKHHSKKSEFSATNKPSNYKNGVSKTKNYKNIQSHIRRVRKKNMGGKFTENQWQELKKRYNYTCPCCHKFESEIKLTIDHIIPITKWKNWAKINKPLYKCNDIENIQPLCGSCNSKKHNICKYDTIFI